MPSEHNLRRAFEIEVADLTPQLDDDNSLFWLSSQELRRVFSRKLALANESGDATWTHYNLSTPALLRCSIG